MITREAVQSLEVSIQFSLYSRLTIDHVAMLELLADMRLCVTQAVQIPTARAAR